MTEKTEQQARQEILDLVAEYARKYKGAPMQQPYHEGERIKKLTDMLLRRGFSWSEIKDALGRYEFELDAYEEL